MITKTLITTLTVVFTLAGLAIMVGWFLKLRNAWAIRGMRKVWKEMTPEERAYERMRLSLEALGGEEKSGMILALCKGFDQEIEEEQRLAAKAGTGKAERSRSGRSGGNSAKKTQ